MRLDTEFIRLPLRYDGDRLLREVQQFDEQTWRDHPQGYAGNTTIALIGAGGQDIDAARGAMLPTEHLTRCPYIQQVFSSLNTVCGRARFMRVAGEARVPPHADLNFYWFQRVRVHIPIVTDARIQFICNGNSIHMGAAEAWIFDTWRTHRVENPTEIKRIHLVVDTLGTSAFWDSVGRGSRPFGDPAKGSGEDRFVAYEPGRGDELLTERHADYTIMPPDQVEAIVEDLRRDLTETPDVSREYAQVLNDATRRHCHDWRSACVLHGESSGFEPFESLNRQLRQTLEPLKGRLEIAYNHMDPVQIVQTRLIRSSLNRNGVRPLAQPPDQPLAQPPDHPPDHPRLRAPGPAAAPKPPAPRTAAPSVQFDRPVFIVCAPRSGSSMLFETLANCRHLSTIGGESHGIFEGIAELNPVRRNFESNRLTNEDATAPITAAIHSRFAQGLYRVNNRLLPDQRVRLLDKLPKNALRIPFLKKIFPDARFIFLHRDPRQNISSVIAAWESGRFITYRQLPGWTGRPWSLVLIPGWPDLVGKPLVQIAATQWRVANACILDDLAELPRSQWCTVSYSSFLDDPATESRRLCTFMDVPCDDALAAAVARPLPPARHTLTPPAKDKWRQHADEIEPEMPSLTGLIDRLKQIQ